MPNCQNCGAVWGWGDTLKIAFKNNKKCAVCGARQYVIPDKRFRTYALFMMPILILVIAHNFLAFSMPVFIALAILLLVIMTAISPYTIKLSNEQKPLW